MQRLRGGSSLEADPEAVMQEVKEDDVSALIQHLPKSQLVEAPIWKQNSTSDTTKDAKMRLQQDPSKLSLVLALGRAYAEDLQWTQCLNVLSRGRGRLSELEENERLPFVILWAEAALNSEKARDALLVLQENMPNLSVPSSRHHSAMLCRVHCQLENYSAAMHAYHHSISGVDFETAMSVLVGLQEDLMRIQGFESARAAVQQLAETQDDRSKLRALDAVMSKTLASRDADEQRQLEKAPDGFWLRTARYWKSARIALDSFRTDAMRSGVPQALKTRLRYFIVPFRELSLQGMLLFLSFLISLLMVSILLRLQMPNLTQDTVIENRV